MFTKTCEIGTNNKIKPAEKELWPA